MLKLTLVFLFTFILTTAALPQWIKQNVNTTASLRGLSVVNEKIVWASGTGGTVIMTMDGGKVWRVITVPGAEQLDFRDIEAFDQFTAYALSIGNGESSRIYKTIDSGKTWSLIFKNTNEKAFFDALACKDRENCIALSDPVNGKFLLIGPNRGSVLSKKVEFAQGWGEDYQGPDAKNGEAAFAASGTCLITQGFYKTFIVSGGNESRVFQREHDGPWTVASVPFIKGTAAGGIFSIAMFDLSKGIIVGGNYNEPDNGNDNLALTSDGGKTWKMGTGLSGYRSGVTYVDKRTILAVGTNGSDISRDEGKTWQRLDKENYNSVQAKGKKAVWAVGPKGMVARLQ